jgi:hypothetical protein
LMASCEGLSRESECNRARADRSKSHDPAS